MISPCWRGWVGHICWERRFPKKTYQLVSRTFWMWVHPDDKEDHDKNVCDAKVRLGITANMTLAGIPWGGVVPYLTKGQERPECDMGELINLGEGGPTMYKPLYRKSLRDYLKALDSEPAEDSEEKVPELDESMVARFQFILGEDDPDVLELAQLYEERSKATPEEAAQPLEE